MSTFVYLQKERERSLLRRHPWVFSKAIENVKGKVSPGAPVEIFSHDGRWLARGAWSPESQIRVRIWTFTRSEQIDTDFFVRRLSAAQQGRQELIAEQGLSAYRLVAAESDGLPGIIIDRYNNFLVCQLLSAGAEFHKQQLFDALKELFPECSLYERSDVAVRKKEGLTERHGVVYGELPPYELVIE